MIDPAPFQIDGQPYEWPGLLNLTIREARLFHQETGVIWESIWIDKLNIADLFKTPGFVPAMARIAYIREHPDTGDDEVKVIIDRQPALGLFATAAQAFATTGTDEAESEDPKAAGTQDVPESSSSPTSNEPSSSPNGTNDPPPTSGESSGNSSAQPASSPAPTGTGESDGRSMSAPLRQVI